LGALSELGCEDGQGQRLLARKLRGGNGGHMNILQCVLVKMQVSRLFLPPYLYYA
jgi:hypothetical protein